MFFFFFRSEGLGPRIHLEFGNHLIDELFQSHLFDSTFDIYEGYRVPLTDGLTSSGDFACHSQEDESVEVHFHVDMHCELLIQIRSF